MGERTERNRVNAQSRVAHKDVFYPNEFKPDFARAESAVRFPPSDNNCYPCDMCVCVCFCIFMTSNTNFYDPAYENSGDVPVGRGDGKPNSKNTFSASY